MKKEINSPQAPAPIGPYSQAIAANGMLYVSGQIALDRRSGNLVIDSITSETHQVMKNLRAILAEAGLDFSNVVKCSIFLSDMGDFATVNDIYGQYLQQPAPARETVAVKTLPKNVNVEISCIAYMPK
ncbi:MAG: RidA family protein [Cyclobacteriaceae bacterium]